MHITEVPERTTIQFDRTVANLLVQPDKAQLQLVFEIDALVTRQRYIDVGNGIVLEREALPGEIDKDPWKEREANEILRRIRKRLLGFLARWKLWKAPLTFEKPAINSEKGATVKVFNIVIHKREKFVDTYLKLLDAVRQHRRYQGMSIADPFLVQSLTKARNAAAGRAASTDFVLNLDNIKVDAGTPAAMFEESSSEPGADVLIGSPPTADLAALAEAAESPVLQSSDVPADTAPIVGQRKMRERRVVQVRGFSLDWD
jgi:hypothetical protein